MSKFASITLIALVAICFVRQSSAQGTLVPLSLSTNGSGEISPFQDGQMLEAGQSYEMTAIPASGFAFASWQPVNVFTLTAYIIDTISNPGTPITNVNVSLIRSLVPEYFNDPVLSFTMQPVQVVYSTDQSSLTEGTGWQANFEPIPEPSAIAFIVLGLNALLLFRNRPGQRSLPNHPAAGKAGIAPQLTIGSHWPGLPEPERWTKQKRFGA